MNHQQIIGKYRRRITIEESKRLQSFPDEYKLSKTNGIAMKQLGNSVNMMLVDLRFTMICIIIVHSHMIDMSHHMMVKWPHMMGV